MASRPKKTTKKTAAKTISRSLLLFVAFLGAVSLSFIFRAKSPLESLADLVRADRPDKDSVTTVVVSASADDKKAESFYSTATNLEEALKKALEKTTSSPDYDTYNLFRLDVAYGGIASNPTKFIETFPTISDYTYVATPELSPRKIPTTPSSLTHKEIEDIIHKSATFLANQVASDGRFIYDRDLYNGEPLSTEYYSPITSAVSASALIRVYLATNDQYLIEQAKKSIDYFIDSALEGRQDPPAIPEDSAAAATTFSETAILALALDDYRRATGSSDYNDILESLIPLAERDLALFTSDHQIPYWLTIALKAYEGNTNLNSSQSFSLSDFTRPTPEELYASFLEPWLVMFEDSPSSTLHAFRSNTCNKTSIIDNQSAIFTLIEYLAKNPQD